MSVRQVGVQEARQLQADEEYTYVDVRSVPEFENGQRGALVIPERRDDRTV